MIKPEKLVFIEEKHRFHASFEHIDINTLTISEPLRHTSGHI